MANKKKTVLFSPDTLLMVSGRICERGKALPQSRSRWGSHAFNATQCREPYFRLYWLDGSVQRSYQAYCFANAFDFESIYQEPWKWRPYSATYKPLIPSHHFGVCPGPIMVYQPLVCGRG